MVQSISGVSARHSVAAIRPSFSGGNPKDDDQISLSEALSAGARQSQGGKSLKDQFTSAMKYVHPGATDKGDATTKKILDICQLYEINPGCIDFHTKMEGITNAQRTAVGVGNTLTLGFLDVVGFPFNSNKQVKTKQLEEATSRRTDFPLALAHLKHFPFKMSFDLNSAQSFTLDVTRTERARFNHADSEVNPLFKIPFWNGKRDVLILKTPDRALAEILWQKYDTHISRVISGR